MKRSSVNVGLSLQSGMLVAAFLLSGCLATGDWVREQVDPLSGRVSETEIGLEKRKAKLGN